MSRNRHTFHPASRSTLRSTSRRTVRVRWRAADDLGVALACFRRAIMAHRRLVRLAPRFFDSALVERERQEQEERRRWREECEAALTKVYGPALEPSTINNADPLPPPLPPGTVAAVELQLAAWSYWLAAGREAKQRFERRHPHALISLDWLVSLISIAMDLGRLAVGLDSSHSSW